MRLQMVLSVRLVSKTVKTKNDRDEDCNEPSEFSIILGCFPSITATAEFVVPVGNACQHLLMLKAECHLPKSIPITCPLIFSSPPVACVEAYRERKEEAGCRALENREMGELRGSCKRLATAGKSTVGPTARENLEASILKPFQNQSQGRCKCE